MKNLRGRHWRLAALACMTLLTVGCGGGGGGGDSNATGDPTAGHAAAGQAVNPVVNPVTDPVADPVANPVAEPVANPAAPAAALNGTAGGVLYFRSAGGDGGLFVGLDLASGVAVALRSGSGSSAAPSGLEFVGIESDSADMIDGDAYSTELTIFGLDGRSVARFGRASYMYSPRLSHDGQRVAFEYSDIDAGDAGGEDILNITDRSGSVLARFRGLSWWDWLPDGRLVAAGGDALYLIDRDLAAARLLRRFAGDTPADLAVSPDGQRLALTLGSRDSLSNHVYVMNIDGSGLRQLTTSSLNEDAPAWSPDGSRLAVRQGIAYSAMAAAVPSGTCPTVWIVPADANAATLSSAAVANGATVARELAMREGDGTRGVCAFSGLHWRSSPAALPSAAGTPIAGAGVNAGLSGRLFYDEPGDVVSLDLASGAIKRWTDAGGSPQPSADGREMAFFADEPDSGSSDQEQISFMNDAGQVSGRIVIAGNSLGGLRGSRDGQRFVLRLNTEDSGGYYPLTVFDRQGRLLAVAPERYDRSAWHPDGRLLVASGGSLSISDLALTSLTPLGSLLDVVDTPAYSPDGSRLAFAMAGHIWVMNADGSNLRQLTVSALSEHSPAWSPDGRSLIVAQTDICPTAWVVPADGLRVWVGKPALPSNALQLRKLAQTAGTTSVCLFSQPQWR